MKLYLIDRTENSFSGYDCYYGHVIVADTEENVRLLASAQAADEGAEVWKDSSQTKVELLSEDSIIDKPTIILSNFNAG